MGMYVLMELEDKNLIYSLNSTLKINIQFKGRVKKVNSCCIDWVGKRNEKMGSHLFITDTDDGDGVSIHRILLKIWLSRY